MTNQEAIKWIKEHHATDLDGCKDSDAMNLAIKALEMQEQKQVICPNCKSDRICWDGDYGHEGAIVQEYTCKDCGARIECYVEGESESDATTIETEQEDE